MIALFVSRLFSKLALASLLLNLFVGKIPVWKAVILWNMACISGVTWDEVIWPIVSPYVESARDFIISTPPD